MQIFFHSGVMHEHDSAAGSVQRGPMHSASHEHSSTLGLIHFWQPEKPDSNKTAAAGAQRGFDFQSKRRQRCGALHDTAETESVKTCLRHACGVKG